MFYNKQMQQDSVLSVPWQLGTKQRPLKKVEFPKVCTTLKKWMDVDMKKKKHISLRSNAVLLHGTTKMYSDEVDALWEDCVQFNNQISRRNLLCDFFTEEDSIIDSTTDKQLDTSEEQSQGISRKTSPSLADISSLQRTSQRKSSKQLNNSEEQSQRKSHETSELMAVKSSLDTTSRRKRSKQLNKGEEQSRRISQETSLSLAEISSPKSQRKSSEQLDTSKEQSQPRSQETSKLMAEKSSLDTTSRRKRSKQREDTSQNQSQRTSQETSRYLSEISPQRKSQRKSSVSEQRDTSKGQSHRSSSKVSEPLTETSHPETSRNTTSDRISREKESEINTQKRRKMNDRSEIVSKDVQGSSDETRNIQFSGSLEMRSKNAFVISREERHRYARWNLNEKLPMAMVLTFGKTVEPEDIIFANIVE